MKISEAFHTRLSELDIVLEDDALEYISGMLEVLDLGDQETAAARKTLKESTQAFFTDANIPQEKINALYDGLLTEIQGSRNPGQKKPDMLKKIAIRTSQSDAEACSTGAKSPSLQTTTTERRRRVGRAARKKQQQEGMNTNPSEPVITATSQQSRFHAETLETTSTDLDLPGVNISVNDNELLVDAHLKLKAGTRYGLVGQNGVGKTVLMRCLADNILVGLPQNIRILHVAQLQVLSDTETVLSEVLAADKPSMDTLREAKALQEVMRDKKQSSTNVKEMNKTIFEIMLARSQDRLEQANRLAIKRSGARGREARKELIQREADHLELASQDPQTFITEEMTNNIVSEVFEKLEQIDLGAMKAKAQKILRGLGFTDEQMDTPISKFSGGWRMKIALAKSLFVEPDILLLDEPTNHLDLHAILWLQEYLVNETEGRTVVVVSHDREFLDAVTEETIIFRDKKLKYHAGNYEDYERNTEEQRIRKQALLDAQERRRKHIMASIQHNVQQARATGDDKRLGMVASRKKKLERLGMEKTEDGKRFKVSYYAGYHLSSRPEIVVEQGVRTAAIKIPEPPSLRYHGPVFSMKNVSFAYPDSNKKIITNFSLDITLGSRIAFLGGNGSGKTTLLNLLVGKLSPVSGEVYRHPLLRVGYFSQHIVDEMDLDKTPVELMMERFSLIKEQECRAHFGTVGVGGSVVLRKIRSLSGGQRNRVALALTLFEAPHVLILDEITNHLDMGTAEMLVEALAGYSGALVLVSHDVWFLKQLMEVQPEQEAQDEDEEPTPQFFLVKPEQPIKRWEKGMDAYVQSVLKTVRRQMVA